MQQRITLSRQPAVVGRATLAQLPLQVLPLILELPDGDHEQHPPPRKLDPRSIERVAAPLRLIGNRMEVRRDRVAPFPKANQLRVMRVAACPSGEHGLG
jgi:hypothetical protein